MNLIQFPNLFFPVNTAQHPTGATADMPAKSGEMADASEQSGDQAAGRRQPFLSNAE